MDAPKVILGYWATRGLAERIRHLLEYLAIPYSEQIFQGVAGKNRWFNEYKPKHLDRNPALTFPFLIDGQKFITQCEAICVYLCLKANRPQLMGRNVQQQVELATGYGLYRDFYPNYLKLVYGRYDENFTFEQALQDTHEGWKSYFVKINGFLGDKKFMAGQLTWLDFGMADFFQVLFILDSSYFKQYPKLIQYQKRVWALPELKQYFEQRFVERPCNNYTAVWN